MRAGTWTILGSKHGYAAAARVVAVACTLLLGAKPAFAERSNFGVGPETHNTLPAGADGTAPAEPLAPPAQPALEVPVPPVAPAAAPAPSVAAPVDAAIAPPPSIDLSRLRLGVFGTNLWAGRGVRRVASAYSMPPLSIGLNVGLEFFSSNSLFVTGDKSTQSEQRFSLSFSPVKGMEVAIAGRSLAFQYRAARVPRNLMLQGNPGLQVKYGHHITGPLALGARVSIVAPASATGSGLSVGSMALRAEALVSVQPVWFLEWTANVGYVYDRGSKQYENRATDAVQRFVYNIDSVDRATWATAVTARFPIHNKVDITPFVEFSGEVGTKRGGAGKAMPSIASIGVRVLPSKSRAIELSVGSDVAMTGAPQVNSPFGGVPPYQTFAQLSVHFHDWAPAVRHRKEAAKNEGTSQALAPDTFLLMGNAFDQQSGRPVQGVRIGFVGEGDALVTSDPQSGNFVSFPIVRAGGDVKLHAEAPGYLALDDTVARPSAGDAHLTLQLSPNSDVAVLGSLKGNVRHAYTAQPVAKARIEVEGQPTPLVVDRRGAFSASLRPGSYRVVIRAPGFLPQHRTLVVSSGERVVLNIDLEPTSR